MKGKDFDIESLLHFSPPKYFCEKCYAIFTKKFYYGYGNKSKEIRCPVCNVEYIPTDEFSKYVLEKYLSLVNCDIEFENIYTHSRKLALIAKKTKDYLEGKPSFDFEGYPPIKAFYDSLLTAQKFIHFCSYGVNPILLGALRLIAQRINIRGIIANVKANQWDELTKFKNEAPNLKMVLYKREGNKESHAIPHHKFVIIDGLMAFKGSANLTLDGWRKSAKGLEIIELVTNVGDVINLNNRYFSPIWAKHSDIKTITMENPDPF